MPSSQLAIGSLEDTTSEVSLDVTGLGGVAIQIGGTFSGTLVWEGTTANRQSYVGARALPSDGTTAATSATATGLWFMPCSGLQTVRVRFSAYTSGSALVSLRGALDGNAVAAAAVDAATETTLSALAGDLGDSADAEATGNGSLIAITKRLRTLLDVTGLSGLTPKYAVIDAATSGNNTLLAAVASKKIRVLLVVLIAAGTVTVRFESGADGTALTGQMALTAQVGFAPGYSPVGHFETAVNTLLNLELSAAISVDGWLVYVEV